MDDTADRALDDFLTLFAVAADEGTFDADAVCAAEFGTGQRASAKARTIRQGAVTLMRDGSEAVADRVRRRANRHFADPAEAVDWLASALAALDRRTGKDER
jgi:hypothetical protein